MMDKDLTIIYGIWITALVVVLALPLIMASPDPGDWWNESCEERYPHNDNGSGYTGIGYFGANVSGWYGIINGSSVGQVYTYNDTDTGNLAVANDTDELCWFDTQNDVSNCPKLIGSAEGLDIYFAVDGDLNDYIGSLTTTTTGTIQYGSGQVNQAYEPDGSNYFKIDDTAEIDWSGKFTLSIWAKITDGTTSKERILHRNPDGASGTWSFYWDENQIAFRDGGSGFMILTDSSSSWNDGNWHLYTITRDSSDNMYLYIDGSQKDSVTETRDYSTDEPIWVGLHNNKIELANSLDDLRIWDGEYKTSTEISNLYSSTKDKFPYLGARERYGCIFNGTVKDPSGNAISGARIVIEEAETDEFVANTTSDASGLWNVTKVLEGNYTIYAYEPGNNSRAGDIKPYVECIP